MANERAVVRPPDHSAQTAAVVRAVMLNQMLFTAGHSLTTGGFLTYFISEFRPSGFWYALLLIAPELAASLSLIARRVSIWIGGRKRTWIAGLIGGRLFALLIPFALLWHDDTTNRTPLAFILICILAWSLLQGIGYVSLISWLSDLVPEVNWGKLFSRQYVAKGIISLTVPLAAGLARAYYIRNLSPHTARWTYSLVFFTGGSLVLLSVFPLLRFPDIPWTETNGKRLPGWCFGRASLRDVLPKGLVFLLASRWWLAFFQGLSQAIMTKYSIQELHVRLEVYYALASLMWGLQLLFTPWAGRLSDANRERSTFFWSLIGVSFAALCWYFATPETWHWLIVAYGLWGLFSFVNISGQNLCLKLSPSGDNVRQYALYDQVSGFIAGVAGLIGGLWFDTMAHAWIDQWPLLAYQVIFLVSFIGRFTAAFWLWPIPDRSRIPPT